MQGTNVPKQPTIPAMPNKREVGGKGMSKKYIVDSDDLVLFDKARPSWWDEAYQRGLNDAWDAAKKIASSEKSGGYSWDELAECFGEEGTIYGSPLSEYRPEEAVAKIREYEQRKAQEDEIKVGDEVKDIDGVIAVVIRATKNLATILIGEACEIGFKQRLCDKDRLTKTGRHVDLSELFGGKEE